MVWGGGFLHPHIQSISGTSVAVFTGGGTLGDEALVDKT